MKALGVILLCAATVFAQEDGRFGTCHFPDVDLEPAVDDLLKRLPKSYILADAVDRDILPGLRVGNTTLHGLSEQRLQGGPRLFCRRGKAMLEIRTHGILTFNAPWRFCGGKSGKALSRCPYLTKNMLFEVNKTSGALVPVDVWLTRLEAASVVLEGANQAVDMIVTLVLTKLLPAVIRDFWVEALPWNTRAILKEIASG